MVTKERKAVGKQAIEWFDSPAKADERPERTRFGRGQTHVFFEEVLHRLINQAGGKIGKALGKVSDREKEGKASDALLPERKDGWLWKKKAARKIPQSKIPG